MKRYRDYNGRLTVSLKQIEKETAADGRKYYQAGNIYMNAADGREYVYIEDTGALAFFYAFSGQEMFIPVASLGTFLPDVASDGRELTLVID